MRDDRSSFKPSRKKNKQGVYSESNNVANTFFNTRTTHPKSGLLHDMAVWIMATQVSGTTLGYEWYPCAHVLLLISAELCQTLTEAVAQNLR